MGNQILGKRPSDFVRGFSEAQVQYLREKFEILRDDKGLLSKQKFQEAYRCPEPIAAKAIRFVDFSENGQVDEYEFICAVAALCNTSLSRLAAMLFEILSDRKDRLDQATLETFTAIALTFCRSVQGAPDPTAKEVAASNARKFKKWDYNASGTLELPEFAKMCLVDKDYKQWMFDMGFITRRQLENEQELYDECDSDLEQEFKRHATEVDPDVDSLKKGVEHRIDQERLGDFQVERDPGDQQAAARQWAKEVAYVGVRGEESDQPPSQSLALEYAFGFRSYDCRNNLKHNSRGRAVYHTAGLGVVLDAKENRQDFMTAHNDDITCLDVSRDTAVTGEVGSKPTLVVWNTDRQDGGLRVEHILSAGLAGSVGNVAISSAQPFVAASCNNEDHTIVVYDLRLLREAEKNPKSKETGLVASGKATKSVICDMKFSSDEKTLVVATAREILFFTFKAKKLQSVRGNFGKHSASAPVSLLAADNLVYSGMVNCAIYVWEKDTCVKALAGHKATVTALCSKEDKKAAFLSGDKNGVIILWSSKQEVERTWELTRQLTQLPRVTALSCSKSSVLVGTRGGDILEYRLEDKDLAGCKTLMSGHSSMDLLALCVHPKSGCFYTGGEDRRIIKWSFAKDRRLEKEVMANNKVRALDVNVSLNLLAVGYENGVVEFLDAETLGKAKQSPIANFKNPDREVLSLIKFDREGRYLAICYTPPNSTVMLYDMPAGKKLGEAKQATRVVAVDFSKDAKVMQLNTANKEYFAYSLPSLKRVETMALNKLKDETWHTQTLPMGPGMDRVLPPGMPEEDVTCCQVSPSGRTVLVGDVYSHLKLYPFPSSPVFSRYKGHSSPLTGLRFTEDEKYVLSAGGQEKAVLLWKYDAKVVTNLYEKDDDDEEGEEGSVDEQAMKDAELRKLRIKKHDEYDELGLQVAEEEDSADEEEGEEAMATGAAKGNILAPSSYEVDEARDNRLPKETLSIEYVFGIRNNYLADEVRNQCRFTSSFKEVVFPTACLGVRMNTQNRAQTYFRGHMEDIVSFAVDPRRELMATGQMAEKNTTNPRKKIVSIHVWDVDSGELLKKLDGFHTIAVVLLEFSPSSKLLFSCGDDDKHSFAVYDWKSGVILQSGPVSGAKVNGVAWNGEDFATCGNKHVKFWTKSKGIQGQIPGKNEAMFSICSSGSAYVTGSGTGNLYNWVGGASAAAVPGHRGKVHTVRCFNSLVYSGGDDGLVLAWATDKSGGVTKYERIFDTRNAFPKTEINPSDLGVLSVDTAPDGRLLLATTGCDIMLLDKDRRNAEVLLSGHSKNELWGLATSWKTDELFVTAGDDGTIRVWSIPEKRQIARYWVRDRRIRAVDWSRDGQLVAAADNRAELHLFSLYGNDLKPLLKAPFKTDISNSKKDNWVEELKFSPNSKMLILGAHGPNLFPELIAVEKDSLKKQKNYKALAFDSALLHADWDTNSEIVGMNTQSYKLVFASVGSQHVSASACRDTDWATWTRKIGWPVQGIFQGVDYTDANSVCADREKRLLAVGYDDQSIRLFRYPAYVPKQVSKQFHGHSSHVTRVRFNNEHLLSVGGMDKTIIVWNVDGRAERVPRKGKDMALQDADESDAQVVDANVDIPRAAIKVETVEQAEAEEFQVVEEEGEEFMAIKPWLGAIKEPTYKYPARGSEAVPAATLSLEYVYGYRSKDCRQNLFYTGKDRAVYHAAAVVVFHNFRENTQSFVDEHRDDILSLAFHK